MSTTQFITATAPCGTIQGRVRDGAHLFAGIPYAQPPIDGLRFKTPVAMAPFDDTFAALKFGPAAPQVASGGMTDAVPVRWSEDCLTLNVSTPACDAAGRAVLVWIHGGGYRTGQSSIPWYAGGKFSSLGDIVVVSINYRLGALGFTDLSHLGDEYATAGVNGLLDQIQALHWVAQNISAFGGDPSRVTIAGESAGGFSVATLLGSRATAGLFHQAIPQSGAAHHTLDADTAAKVSETFLSALGVDDPVGLQAIGVEQILAAQTQTIKALETGAGVTNRLGTTVSPFYPVHGTDLLPVSPLQAIREGVGSEVAVLTGTNTHETTLWGYGRVDDDKLLRIARSLQAESTLAAYRQDNPDATAADLVVALTTDHMFRIPAIRLAEARSEHADNTWMYLFNWHSRVPGLKATHALEIPFAFNNLDKAGVDAFIGPGESPQHVADVMHQAWTRFINEGDPGWPAYRPPGRTTMVFDETSTVVQDPHASTRQVWEGLR